MSALTAVVGVVVLDRPQPAVGQSQETLQMCLDQGGRCEPEHAAISLTQTLILGVDGTQLLAKNTRLRWDGPSGEPMVVVQAANTEVSGLVLIAGAAEPSMGIEVRNYPANPVPGAPAIRNRIVNVRIGETRQTMDYGIRITGDENGDSNHFETVSVAGARIAGFDLQNPQAVLNNFVNVRSHWSGIGFRARAVNSQGTHAGPFRNTITDIGFGGNLITDLDVGPEAGIDIRGMYSELSHRLAVSSGSISIAHGYWQRCEPTGGQSCPGGDPVSVEQGVVLMDGTSSQARLRLTDFAFTPNDGHRERAVGLAPDRCFLSEVQFLDCVGGTTTPTSTTSTTSAISSTTSTPTGSSTTSTTTGSSTSTTSPGVTTTAPSGQVVNVDLRLNESPGMAIVCPPAGRRIVLKAYDLTPSGGPAVLRDGAGPTIVATLPADQRSTWQDANGRYIQYCLTAHGPANTRLTGTITYTLG